MPTPSQPASKCPAGALDLRHDEPHEIKVDVGRGPWSLEGSAQRGKGRAQPPHSTSAEDYAGRAMQVVGTPRASTDDVHMPARWRYSHTHITATEDITPSVVDVSAAPLQPSSASFTGRRTSVRSIRRGALPGPASYGGVRGSLAADGLPGFVSCRRASGRMPF